MPPRSRNSHLLDQVQPGDEIEVWWPHDSQYYSGVVGAQLPSGRHRIFYNDGEIEDLKLATEQWRFIGAAADRIIASHPAPSLDGSSLQPHAHQPASQPDHNQTTNHSQPAPPSNSNTTTTGKKRGRPRGRKSDTTKTPKSKPTRAPQSSSLSAANDKQTANKPHPAKPLTSPKPTSTTKPKANAVKKRQRSSSTPAQDAKSIPANAALTPGDKPLLVADDSLIDAAPLAPKLSKQSSSSPAAQNSAITAPAPAASSPSGASPTATNDSQKKSGVISKPSHTPTSVLAPSAVKKDTIKRTTMPATVSTRNAVPLRETPAKKSATTNPRASESKASSTPRLDSANTQAIPANRLAVIQKSPGASGRATQSDSKKVGTPTTVQQEAAPIAPAATASLRDQTPVSNAGAPPKAIAPTANSKAFQGKEAIQNTPAPLKHSPQKATGKPDAMKGVEMASATCQQKTFILAANGTIREKPSQPQPKVPTLVKVRQGSGSLAKQIKPQPVSRESPKSAVSPPKDTTGEVQSKMALATIVSGHQEQKKTSINRSEGRSADSPSANSKRHDATKHGTSGLKKRDSVLQTGQKGSSKSKSAKVSKPLGVKKTTSKPVKTIPLKRFVTHPLLDSKGIGTPAKPKDGSDIIANVTVPRKSKSGATSPLPRSPLHLRPSPSSPSKPISTTSGKGSTAKTGPDLKKFTLDQAAPKTAPSVVLPTQDKGERAGSKLSPFQPTRRRLKGMSGGVAHQGLQHQSTTTSDGKPSQPKLPHHPAVSDKGRQGRSSEPQRLNTQREQIVVSKPTGTKSYRSDDTSRRASQRSPKLDLKDPIIPQVSTPSTGLVTGSLAKTPPASLPKQGKMQPRPQQPGTSSNVNKCGSKDAFASDSPVPDAPSRMEIDENINTGVKRAAPETLNNPKRRRPNTPRATASNTAANASGSETVQGKTVANVTNGGELDTQVKTNHSPSADAVSVAVSKAQSLRTQAADDEGISTAKFAAPQRVGTRVGLGKDTQVRSSGNSSIPSKSPVKAPVGEKDQPSKNLSDASKMSSLAASKEGQQSRVEENREGEQDSQPAVTTPPKSFARVRQRLSAGPSRPNKSSRGIVNNPKDVSEMSASSAINAIKQAVREANVESLQPQLAPVVTRIEKCFADSDRRVRSLQGQLDRSTKAVESLQKQLQDLRKAISYVPSISEVRSLLESQSLEMKRAAAMSMESVVAAVKEDMKEYFPREIKTGMENVAALVQKDSIMVISKAVDSAMTSGLLLQDIPRASEPNRANGQQNATTEPNVDVANEASLRGTAPGSAEVYSNHTSGRRQDSAEALRPTSPSGSIGTGLGASGRESKGDGPSGDVAKESTQSPTSDPNAGSLARGLPSQNVPERVNGSNLCELQPVLSSNGPTTGGFERNERLSRASGNEGSAENQEIPEGPDLSQGKGEEIDSKQNAHSRSVPPLSNGFHPDSSTRPESMSRDVPASEEKGSSVGSNELSAVAKSSTVPRRSQLQAALARKENYGYVSNRMKVLLARSAVEWFLKGGCRDFAPQNERTSPVSEKWVRDSVQRSLRGILQRLQPEEDFKEAMTTLAHSVGLDIQTDWLLKGPTIANINIARTNYAEWDPQLFDFEWESEKRVLAMLSDELLRSEKILMTAGEFFEDPLRTAIRCVEHATKEFSS